MAGRILLFPFWIIKKGIGAVSGVVRIIFGTAFGAFRFILRRRIGTLILVVIGILLGKKILKENTEEEKKD